MKKMMMMVGRGKRESADGGCGYNSRDINYVPYLLIIYK